MTIRSISATRVDDLYSAQARLPAAQQKQKQFSFRIEDTLNISDEAFRRSSELMGVTPPEAIVKDRPLVQKKSDLAGSLETLGISSQTASRDEIRKAFRVALQQYHPDKFSQSGQEIREFAENKTKEIIEAYQKIQKSLT